MKKLITILMVAACFILIGKTANAQISIPNTTPVTENFTIGTSTTASLPSNWKMTPAGTSAPTWSSASNVTAVTQGASTGSPSAGGRYNWGRGTATTDRSVGFMTSGSYASPNSIMAFYRNTNANALTALNVSFTLERYRINSSAANIRLFYSTDGTTWSTVRDSVGYTTGSSTYGFPRDTVNRSVNITGLNIANNGNIYLRWDFNTTGTNSQGLGLDNVSITGTFAAGGTPTISVVTTSFNGAFGGVVNGSSSSSSTYSVSGTNLTNNIIITPPTGFQIRTGANAFSTSAITLTQSGGTVNSTNIDVRFTPTGTGAFSGNITNTSTGATTQNVAVSGNGISTQPTTQASNVTFSSVTTGGFTINFNAGNGSNRIVLVKEASAVDSLPVDGTSYTANATFQSGSEIGTGNFVVYNGTGTSVTVSGLSGAVTYHVAVYEFNGSAGTENYNTTSPAINSQLTLTPSTSVVINKYVNNTTDAVELLVIEDNLDMRGMIIKDYSSNMTGDGGGKFTFESCPLWSSVRAGTIIILRNSNTAADTVVGGTDYTIDVGLTNTVYFVNNGGTFDISSTDMVQIKSAGSSTSGSTGAIHTLAGGTAGSLYTSSPTPKLIGTGTTATGFGVFAVNPNSSVGDYNGTNATGNTAAGSLTFGSGNNSTNTTYIVSLRNIAVTSNTSLAAGTFNSISVSGSNVVATLTGNITVGNVSVEGNSTLTLGSNTLTGSGSAAFSGTGTISLNEFSQISGFSNSFGGSYYLTGTNTSVPSGTYNGLTVNGGGAALAGDVIVNGTLNLNGTFTIGAHTLTISNPIGVTPSNLVMNSTSSLVVDGTANNIHIPSSVTALNNLTLNNNQVVTADGNITVNGTLTLGASSGFLDMGANTLEIGTSTSNVGALVRNGGSIRGTMKRWLSASTGSRLFPLDNGSGNYSAADVNFTSAPGTGGSLTATFHNSAPGSLPDQGNGNYLPTGPEMGNVNLINIAPQWWTISAGDGLSGGTYNLDITGDALPNVVNINYIAIIKRVDAGNPWTYVSGNFSVTTGTNSNPVLHYTGGTSFSDFGVGGNVDNPLPVELTGFTSSVSGTNVTLSWSTGFEENNAGFDVERKSTVGGWSKIGNVAGHGTVNTPNSYSYSDRNLTSGRYSYRLKQIDFNGNYKYYDLSNEVVIGTPSKYVLSQNYPNPFNPSTSISYEIPAANFVTLKIYDMMGKEVASLVNAAQEAGFYTVKFDASNLASGVYFYKLQANDFTATKKLMLMK